MPNIPRSLQNLLSNPQPLRPVGYKPAFAQLQNVYSSYRRNQDLHSEYTNECAIRLSIALSLSGFQFDSSYPGRVFRSSRAIGIPFVIRAHELALYLRQVWGEPERFRGVSPQQIVDSIQFRQGVVYFNNVSGAGDHIDLWMYIFYYNQALGIEAHAGRGFGNLFSRANEIWFWQLP